MDWTSWSECVAYGKKLQNGEPGIIDKIKTVEFVEFRDFVESWGTLDQRSSEREIQAVKKVLGIIQHLKIVGVEDCNLCEDHLRILHDVFKGVEIDDLFIHENTNIGVEGWHYVGQIVFQSRVKDLIAWDCDATDECLKRFMQGMDRAQLEKFDISCNSGDSKNADSFNVLLKLLPLIREQLQLCTWEFTQDQEVELQKNLNKDCLRSLTICYDEWGDDDLYLKASPMELPPILPGVEDLEARNTNGTVQLEWYPLSIVNTSYYIIVEDYFDKAVGEPIVSTDTNCQISSLQSNKYYHFFIWGFTDDGISKRVAGIQHETGDIFESQQNLVEAQEGQIAALKQLVEKLEEKCRQGENIRSLEKENAKLKEEMKNKETRDEEIASLKRRFKKLEGNSKRQRRKIARLESEVREIAPMKRALRHHIQETSTHLENNRSNPFSILDITDDEMREVEDFMRRNEDRPL